MNAFLRFDGIEWWNVLGWTMLHFLWMGTLVGFIAGMCRLLLRRSSPNVRYVAATTALALLAILPIGIAVWLSATHPVVLTTARSPNVQAATAARPDSSVESTPLVGPSADEIVELAGPDSMEQFNRAGTESISPMEVTNDNSFWQGKPSDIPHACAIYLPWVWLFGTPVTFVLLATGTIGTRRLRRVSRAIDEGPIVEALTRLATSMRLGKHIAVAVCDRIATPVLIGILRPLILLPPAALTNWSPDEIEMVLLHELAHVRRWDNLVNLAQRIVESLLFFHPVVWLVSNWIRREREACCDAIVVDRTKRPQAYAELLVALAAHMPRSMLFHPAASSAMAAGPLRSRIRRILQLEDDPMLVSGKSFVLVLGSLVVAATIAVLYLPAIGQAKESTSEGTLSAGTKPDTPANADTEELSSDRLLNDTPSGEVVTEARKEPEQIELGLNDTSEFERSTDNGDTTSFEAYNVPDELTQHVETWAQLMKIRGYSDRPGRFIMQASADVHAQLQELLQATPGWMKTAVAHRREAPIRNYESNGQTRLEWRTMGMTVGSPREVERANMLPREVVGLEIVAIEPGSPAAWLTIRPNDTITNIASFKTSSLPQFKSMIQTMLDGSTKARYTITIVRTNGDELRTYLPRTVTKGVGDESTEALPSRDSEADSSKRGLFPSLEEQKLADLAFKRLGLELEALDGEDLRRVKAMGYDGGVKVTSGAAGTQHTFIQTTDIIVGLHVWPTTNLQDVAAILNRDDLAELNPLKFYVVRKRESENNTDEVITGRVSVNLPARGRGAIRSAAPAAPQSVAPAGDLSKYVAEAITKLGIDPHAGPMQVEMVPQESGSTLVVRGRKADDDVPPYVLPSAAEEDKHPEWPKQDLPGVTPKLEPTARSKSAQAPRRQADSRSNLRYESKTFEEWRSAWQTELSTNKRIEAVKALAAFGRAGYPKEAADAILDVAGEYDFSVIESDGVGKLKEAILNELAPKFLLSSFAEKWLPELATRVEQEPKKWQPFAGNLLWRLRTEDERVIAILRTLAKAGPEEIRGDALLALVTCLRKKSGGAIDDETRGLITAALQSNNRQTTISALGVLLRPSENGAPQNAQLLFQPEIVPLLFDADPQIQQYAQHVLRYIRSEDAPQVVEKLATILQDQAKKGDHVAAIRSLSAIGQHAKSTVPQLEQILKDGNAIEARVAAGHAIDAIEGGGRGRNELLRQSNDVQDEKEKERLTRLINGEEKIQQVQHRN